MSNPMMSSDDYDELDDARGGMIVIAIAELTVIVAIVGVAIFWSGIWSGAI